MQEKIRDIPDLKAEFLKDLLFPIKCPICGDTVNLEDRVALYEYIKDRNTAKNEGSKPDFDILYKAYICRECIDSFSYICEPMCKKCGKKLIEEASGLCKDCNEKIRIFETNRAIINYDETARSLMHDLKYHGNRELGVLLGIMAAERLGNYIRKCEPAVLIPIPIHEDRLRERGYNQAAIIAETIGEIMHIAMREDILLRRKNTKAQNKLDRDDRLKNLQNAFYTPFTIKQNKTALIVDDIYTTGSTLEAATECLKNAGWGKVYALTIAAGES